MAWYWWILIGIGVMVVLAIIASVVEGSQRPPEPGFFDGLGPVREDIAMREAVGKAALELILDLPMITTAGPGDIQSRDIVSKNVMNMARTRHVRLHLATATERITLVQGMADRSGRAVVRSYQRSSAESWRVSTHMAEDFDAAVDAAEID